ncbi:aspartate kinase, partial [Candidatus Saccharibacteria bacterium]|nr:aspartate kinase [Candidatus Saccharibacteria bacterium]
MKPLVVMKFGGTSVGDAERMQDVASIVKSSADNYRVVVVVSAMSGVTDLLVNAADQAAARSKRTYQNSVRAISEKHLDAI